MKERVEVQQKENNYTCTSREVTTLALSESNISAKTVGASLKIQKDLLKHPILARALQHTH